MTTTPSYEIDTIEDLHGLLELRPEIDELAPATQTEPWQSSCWLVAAAKAFAEDSRPRVITVRREGKLTAVAPMALKRSDQPLRPQRLDVLGGEELKEPSRFIASSKEDLKILAAILADQNRYPVRLSRMCYDDETLDCFLSTFKEAGWITRVMSMAYPFLELTPNPIKKSLARDLRRARRKAEKHGSLSFRSITAADPSELDRELGLAMEIEASGWKGRNGTAILANQGRRRFFERYAADALGNGVLRLNFLLLDGRPIAMQYAIESKNQYWLLSIGYDERHRAFSPGNLLLEESILDASRRKLERYNFLGKEEPWTERWSTGTEDCFIVAAYRLNLPGIRAMCSDALYLAHRRWQDWRRRSRRP